MIGIKWKVDFYENKIEKFLDNLSEKERAKVLRDIFLLEKFGLNLKGPYIRSLKPYGLLELRTIFRSKIFRSIFFNWKSKKLVILNTFVKKTRKTPKKEIEIALTRRKKYKNKFK